MHTVYKFDIKILDTRELSEEFVEYKQETIKNNWKCIKKFIFKI